MLSDPIKFELGDLVYWNDKTKCNTYWLFLCITDSSYSTEQDYVTNTINDTLVLSSNSDLATKYVGTKFKLTIRNSESNKINFRKIG